MPVPDTPSPAPTAIAPIADATAFTFAMVSPNTQAVKDAITAELTDLLKPLPKDKVIYTHCRAGGRFLARTTTVEKPGLRRMRRRPYRISRRRSKRL
jgi:hypothetical protein